MKKDDDGYPFDTGHWERWTNVERLAWMKNFRDKLSANGNALARKLGLTDEQVAKIAADTAEMERTVARERAHLN